MASLEVQLKSISAAETRHLRAAVNNMLALKLTVAADGNQQSSRKTRLLSTYATYFAFLTTCCSWIQLDYWTATCHPDPDSCSCSLQVSSAFSLPVGGDTITGRFAAVAIRLVVAATNWIVQIKAEAACIWGGTGWCSRNLAGLG
jgi:hypothetical protein